MDTEVLKKAQEWVKNAHIDEDARNEIKALVDKGDEKELTERFYKDLEFGTGGMRSILGMGTNRINKYTIRKATQALANVVLATKEAELKVAISYDSRRMSKELALESANVLVANGIHAYIYNRLNPVALLSYSVRRHKAQAGIMVTASHNPPEYNGFKVFWRDGAQVTEPNDKKIIDAYYSLTDFGQVKTIDSSELEKSKLFHWVGEDVENEYFAKIYESVLNKDLCKSAGKNLSIVYTPIHGTGLIPCKKALLDNGFSNLKIVEEQAQPDGNFPTVKSPNPENPDALAMAVALMEGTGADITMGSDPDTDRLGVALKHDGKVQYLNGNQIGVLMLHYVLTQLKEQNRMPNDPYFVKTIVTSPLQDVVAEKFGVEVENTLTGFKWICRRVKDIEDKAPNRNFIFGTEESFGYLNHPHVRDKDGVSSVLLMAEVALWYKEQGLNLFQGLDKIYEEYGFSHETLLSLDYFGKEGAEKISRIMEMFRNYPENQFCEETILKLEDYNSLTTTDKTDGKSSTLNFPKSNVLGFKFESGNQLYLRPSGTEPKIKFYIMIQERDGDLKTKKENALTKTELFLKTLKEMAERA